MDERDLPKAPLSLFHILEASVDVGDGEWTGRGWWNGVEKEVGKNGTNFKFTTSTKFNINPRDRYNTSSRSHALYPLQFSPHERPTSNKQAAGVPLK